MVQGQPSGGYGLHTKKDREMWEDYKPTKAEREMIEGAYRYIAECHINTGELDKWMKQERKGYGDRNDAISTIAAKGLCVQWFLQGINKSDALLRDFYNIRPAALWLMGKGADRKQSAPAINMPCLESAKQAHDTVFKRMVKSC